MIPIRLTADKSPVNATQSSNELEKLKAEIAQLKQVIVERNRQLQAAESRIKELETLPTRLLNEYINEHNPADKLPNPTRYRYVKELSRFKAWLETQGLSFSNFP
jgi:predicted  nucleic acid-binding Zn-ribbon protein